jgi:hypothetical protein
VGDEEGQSTLHDTIMKHNKYGFKKRGRKMRVKEIKEMNCSKYIECHLWDYHQY